MTLRNRERSRRGDHSVESGGLPETGGSGITRGLWFMLWLAGIVGGALPSVLVVRKAALLGPAAVKLS